MFYYKLTSIEKVVFLFSDSRAEVIQLFYRLFPEYYLTIVENLTIPDEEE